MEPFIKIVNLEKVYPNGAKAVYNFNLDINKNEFVVLVGPSGCGKTTTLRMIAGLEDITKGDLYINGEYSNYKPSKDRKIAIVFQSYALYPQMNVFENIAFPLTVNKYRFPVVDKKLLAYRDVSKVLQNFSISDIEQYLKEAEDKKYAGGDSILFLSKRFGISRTGAKELISLLDHSDSDQKQNLIGFVNEKIAARLKELNADGKTVNEYSEYLDADGNVVYESRKMDKYEIQDKVFAAAEILDLGPYLNRLPKQLSGGQMQRVALGRAIVKDVPLFLMDEPLSNLDARLRVNMRAEIVKLHKRINATTIYVTHDQTEAMTMADRIVVMSKGFIQQIDKPKEIYENPSNLFVAKFIGTPSINIIEGSIRDNVIEIGQNFCIELTKERKKRVEKFYRELYDEFKLNLDAYDSDESAKEFILRVVSAMEEKHINSADIFKTNKFKAMIRKLKSLFAKNKGENKTEDSEKKILQEKTNALMEYCGGAHPVLIGLRPENVCLEDVDEDSGQCALVTPSLIELLGSELYVHFDFEGNELIAKVPSDAPIDTNKYMKLKISLNDVFLFDPVSGRRIYFDE